MWINIPLLPLKVEVQRRTIPPFRLTIWGMMIAVGIAGGFFAIFKHVDGLAQLNRYHAEQTHLNSGNITWHMAMCNEYAARIESIEMMTLIVMVSILTLVLIGIVGRVLDRIGNNTERR